MKKHKIGGPLFFAMLTIYIASGIFVIYKYATSEHGGKKEMKFIEDTFSRIPVPAGTILVEDYKSDKTTSLSIYGRYRTEIQPDKVVAHYSEYLTKTGWEYSSEWQDKHYTYTKFCQEKYSALISREQITSGSYYNFSISWYGDDVGKIGCYEDSVKGSRGQST